MSDCPIDAVSDKLIAMLSTRLLIEALKLALALALVAAIGAGAGVAAAHGATCDNPGCFDARPADDAWSQEIHMPQSSSAYRGDGVTVATIDTGVTPAPDLGSRLLARVDLTADHDGLDRFGHGTHIAGLIAGDPSASALPYEGVAPGARLVSLKTAGWDGATDVSTVIAALRWAVSHREQYGIRVVNLSWGTDGLQGYAQDPLDRAVERAWRAGLVVVVAAGNGGPAPGTIAKPGDDPFVITVGAADTHGTPGTADDELAPFSGRGPTTDGIAKPDLIAPGVSLASLRAPDSTIDVLRPEARVGDQLLKGSGTSQAAALVSGVAARVLSANPALTPDQVKALLTGTADGGLAGPGAGAGMVDAAAALSAAAGAHEAPRANAGLTPSTGTGTLAGARGSDVPVTDLDADGAAEPLRADVDALGLPWTGLASTWGASSWPTSPWAPLTAEIAGSDVAPAWAGPAPPRLAWDPSYWGARSAPAAGWTPETWQSRYWGSRYWGASLWN